MAAPHTDPRPVLAEGAVYWADNGRRICAKCAGASAKYTGHDISGQAVARVTLADVEGWPDEFGRLACEAGCTTLSPIAGPDGWPMVAAPRCCPCGCDGRIDDHDDRGWGCWDCPLCGEESDRDLDELCSACAAEGSGDA
jgi:hypothetical protein